MTYILRLTLRAIPPTPENDTLARDNIRNVATCLETHLNLSGPPTKSSEYVVSNIQWHNAEALIFLSIRLNRPGRLSCDALREFLDDTLTQAFEQHELPVSLTVETTERLPKSMVAVTPLVTTIEYF